MSGRVPSAAAGPAGGFEPPVYPYERLAGAREKADAHPGGVVDLSIGTPTDPTPPAVVAALSTSGAEAGYPMSVGSGRYREAAAGWMARRLGVEVDPAGVCACVGTKEFVSTLPHWLRLRSPERDTVLHPAVAYPSYAMGATLAGCRAVPVPVDDRWRLDLSAVDPADARRALLLWVNSPGNPAGQLDDLEAAAEWGRSWGVPVFSDECYVEYTWDGPRRSVLGAGPDGVVAVHSLSKRSNAAGLRAGFYAGDAELVRYLSEVRKHVGLLVPGPVQAAAAVALDDDAHVDAQRLVYRRRLDWFAALLRALGVEVALPGGGFYLWAPAPGGDAWGFTERLAADAGCLVSPGDLYGEAGAGWVRIALVRPIERLELVARRLGVDVPGPPAP
ncbi:MAG: aminotransferase class I/II-fold pyridoxal phosphate-dependent enzyme [Actinomycetota bacterium]|nr:aminotransferase class I/II-fold pyridoxal phosphate-dependent enzyme [Actinomycetota bacterium]